nr:VOC family protein [Marinicella sp. W31]MDC2876242.1 VOC family protein [Marinicella sp. W31]
MQGQFIWYELLTTDTKAASAFYGSVAGWVAKDSGMPAIDYTICDLPGYEMGLAGMMALTDDMCEQNVPPHWLGYVYVDDVDAKTAEFADKGSTTLMPPHDIPGIGRFSVMRDPQSAAICLMQPVMPEGPMPSCPQPGSPALSAGTNFMRMTVPRPCRSIPRCSTGNSCPPTISAPWAPT